MKYSRIFLWILILIFLVAGRLKNEVLKFSDTIAMILLGTLLLLESIEYKKSHGRDLRFYSTRIYSIIAYLLAAYFLFSSLA